MLLQAVTGARAAGGMVRGQLRDAGLGERVRDGVVRKPVGSAQAVCQRGLHGRGRQAVQCLSQLSILCQGHAALEG